MIGDSTVATQALPVALAGANVQLDDPTVVGLLDFAAFLIRWALNDRLAQIQGPTTGAAVSDACPAANVHPINPETTFVRMALPALYGWWEDASKHSEWTLIYGQRERTIRMLYIFPEIVLPGGAEARNGLISVVDACFGKLANEYWHPSYGYNGDPAGTPITQSLGLLDLAYIGGEQGLMSEVPGSAAGERSVTRGHVQRGYPSLRANFTVWERVGVSTPEVPDDVQGDTLTTISVNEQGDTADTVTIKEGYLPAADGSET